MSSNQKRLDRPELREKIAINLPTLWCDECPYFKECKAEECKACKRQLDYADQILALIKGEK